MNNKSKSNVKRKIKRIAKIPQWNQRGIIYSGEGIAPALCATDYKGPTKIMERVMDYQDGKCQPVLTPDRLKKRQNGRRMKEDGEEMFTLTAQDKHGIYDGYRIRRLTPIECERLQGFPDNWTKYGKDGELISDTQRYRCLGNAVTTNVIEYIFNNWDLNVKERS